MAETIRDTAAMIRGMTPALADGDYVFVTVTDAALRERLRPLALAAFREDEGLSLIVARDIAGAAGLDTGLPMRQLTLKVYSALDGVGLTAAVSTALAARGIACNMVSAFHHDHVFVPSDQAEAALEVLRALAAAGPAPG